jgi:tetratricopeptide (TPR) repeat protein
MKPATVFHIAAIALLLGCLVVPVFAGVEIQEPETVDIATSYYNHAETAIEKGNYEEAITLFDLALASNTTMIKWSDALLYTYRDKAYCQIQLEQYENAIATIDAGLAEYPKDAMLWNNKGYADYRLGRYQDALDAYNRAIQEDREYTIAMINRGDTLFAMGRCGDAVSAYNDALATDPGNRDATAGLARAQECAGPSALTMTIVIIIIVLIIAGGAVWYLKFRKPAEETKSEEKK